MKLFRVSLPDAGAQSLAQKLIWQKITFNVKHNTQEDVVVFESDNVVMVELFIAQVKTKHE